MPKHTRKRKRSSSSVNAEIISILKKLEKRVYKIEESQSKRKRAMSSDSGSEMEHYSNSEKSESTSESDGEDSVVELSEEGTSSRSVTQPINSVDNDGTNCSTLKQNMVSALEKEVNISKKIGLALQQRITEKWQYIIKTGMESEKLSELLKKYPPPENGTNFEAPSLNPEVKQIIQDVVYKRDERLMSHQAQVGGSLVAIELAISSLLREEDGGDSKMVLIEQLSDAGRLLSDLHHKFTASRKELVCLNLKNDWKDILGKSPTDKLLFGEDLEERVKAVKSLVDSAGQLKDASMKKATIKKNHSDSRSQLKNHSDSRNRLQNQRGARQSGRHSRGASFYYYHNRVSKYKSYQERTRGESVPQNLENYTPAFRSPYLMEGRLSGRPALQLVKLPEGALDIFMESVTYNAIKEYS